MFKIVFVLSLALLSLQSAVFSWESAYEQSSKEKRTVAEMLQGEIDTYLKPRPPIDISGLIPPQVPVPSIPQVAIPIFPPQKKLVKGEFEREAEFNARVEKEAMERKTVIENLQKLYRSEVEKRNLAIEQASARYKQEVEKRNLILQKLQFLYERDIQAISQEQQNKKANLDKLFTKFATNAIGQVYGNPQLTYTSFDPETNTLFFTLSSSRKNYSKKMMAKIPREVAQKLKPDFDKLKPIVKFDLKMDEISGANLSLEHVALPFMGNVYAATPSSKEYKPDKIEITLVDKKMDTNSSAHYELDLQASTFDMKLQNPNLNEKYEVGAFSMGESVELFSLDDALFNRIKKTPANATDSTKWLFLIAIENYDETDPVIYSKRSAYAMEQVFQKRFGIAKSNTYSLIEKDATSGKIKDKLNAMLAKVSQGDTIYFYYSGHGIPGQKGDAYILPKDKVVDFIERESDFRLESIYRKLANSKAKHTFAFIDACFSGSTDNKSVFKGVAAAILRTKKVHLSSNNITILTAGTEEQFSNSYDEKKQRLFSYYLADFLMNGVVSPQELHQKVRNAVLHVSTQKGERYEQEPQLYGNTKKALQ